MQLDADAVDAVCDVVVHAVGNKMKVCDDEGTGKTVKKTTGVEPGNADADAI